MLPANCWITDVCMLGSCPDICFTVNHLSQFGSKPTKTHLLSAQHILRYLSTTKGYKLTYGNNNSTELISHCDSDWATDTDDCHLTSGYTFILSGGSIAWGTQKQSTWPSLNVLNMLSGLFPFLTNLTLTSTFQSNYLPIHWELMRSLLTVSATNAPSILISSTPISVTRYLWEISMSVLC